MKKILHGIVCANITPFDPNGEVDYQSVRSLSRYLVEAGMDAVYPLGTNGEGIYLTLEERKKVAETMVQEIAGRIPVVIQCGTGTVRETVELILHAKAIGADAAGVVTPFFFRQNQDALIEYYDTVLKASGGFPVYLYNIPSFTSNDILPKSVAEIRHRCPNLAGIKYSHPDLIRLSEYLAVAEGFDALIGCDSLIWPAYALGAVGTVSGPAAVFPELFRKLWACCERNDTEGARKYQEKIKSNDEALAPFQSVPMLKIFLQSRGVISETICRVPYRKEDTDRQKVILKTIDEFKQYSDT